MTIKLTAETESRLIMGLAEGLQTVVLGHGFPNMPSLQWASDLHSNLSADDRNKLDRYCGEPGFQRFIYGEISADLRKLPQAEKEPAKPLIEIGSFRNTIAYGKKLVERLKNVPQRFRLTVALPTEISDPILGEIDTAIDLRGEIRVATGDNLITPFPFSSPHPNVDAFLFRDPLYGTEQPRAVFSDRLYFTMPLVGYANVWSMSFVGRLRTTSRHSSGLVWRKVCSKPTGSSISVIDYLLSAYIPAMRIPS